MQFRDPWLSAIEESTVGLGFRRSGAGSDLRRIESGFGDSAVEGQSCAVGGVQGRPDHRIPPQRTERRRCCRPAWQRRFRTKPRSRIEGELRGADRSGRRCVPWGNRRPVFPCWPARLCNGGTGSQRTRRFQDPWMPCRDTVRQRVAGEWRGWAAKGRSPNWMIFSPTMMCFLIGSGEETEAVGLLLAGFVSDVHGDPAHAGDLGLLDGLYLPHGVLVEAEIGLHEGIHKIFGRRGGGEVSRIRSRKDGSGGGRCAEAGHGCGGSSDPAQRHDEGRKKQGQCDCSGQSSGITDQANISFIAGRPRGRLPIFSLYLDFDGDGKAAAHAEGLGSHLQDRSGLVAFVFRPLHQANYLLDEFERKTILLRDACRGLIAFDICLEDGVEDIVGRQRIRILLIGTQFSGGRLLDNGPSG